MPPINIECRRGVASPETGIEQRKTDKTKNGCRTMTLPRCSRVLGSCFFPESFEKRRWRQAGTNVEVLPPFSCRPSSSPAGGYDENITIENARRPVRGSGSSKKTSPHRTTRRRRRARGSGTGEKADTIYTRFHALVVPGMRVC